jgi:hypothetical protein
MFVPYLFYVALSVFVLMLQLLYFMYVIIYRYPYLIDMKCSSRNYSVTESTLLQGNRTLYSITHWQGTTTVITTTSTNQCSEYSCTLQV